MDTQFTDLLLEGNVNFIEMNADEEDQASIETMQAFGIINLDEEEVILAREAAKHRVNRTELRRNIYVYNWSDAHGALWDKVKKSLAPTLDTWGATLDKVEISVVSVAAGGGIKALPGTISFAIPMHEDELEKEIYIETPTPRTRIHKNIWRHNLAYSLLEPGTAIGTRKDEIYLLLANFKLNDE